MLVILRHIATIGAGPRQVLCAAERIARILVRIEADIFGVHRHAGNLHVVHVELVGRQTDQTRGRQIVLQAQIIFGRAFRSQFGVRNIDDHGFIIDRNHPTKIAVVRAQDRLAERGLTHQTFGEVELRTTAPEPVVILAFAVLIGAVIVLIHQPLDSADRQSCVRHFLDGADNGDARGCLCILVA